MAAYSITIANSLRVWGPAESDKWNDYNWNAFVWGEGTAGSVQTVGKVLSETATFTDSLSLVAGFYFSISNTLLPTSDMGSEQVSSGDYQRVYPSNTTEGESRISSTWSAGAAGSSTWTSGTATSTTWSQS